MYLILPLRETCPSGEGYHVTASSIVGTPLSRVADKSRDMYLPIGGLGCSAYPSVSSGFTSQASSLHSAKQPSTMVRRTHRRLCCDGNLMHLMRRRRCTRVRVRDCCFRFYYALQNLCCCCNHFYDMLLSFQKKTKRSLFI